MGGGSQRVRGPGKAHKSGLGAGVMRRVNGGDRASSSGRGMIGQYSHLFTTDLGDGRAANMQSVLDVSDLDEMMAMADLAGRSFAAERQNVVIVSMGGAGAEEALAARASARRAAAQAAEGRLTVPRRPPWRKDMTPEELDARERESFLIWRRDLATLEEGEDVGVTPFEKNLEVWRQLWRVLERSDLVCQVVDSRDPLRYRCPDLENYVEELGEGRKRPLLLLNKADLLPPALRKAWARYFDEQGVDYIFWSALAAAEPFGGAGAEAAAAAAAPLPSAPPRPGAPRTGARVVGRDELLRLLEARAAAAAVGEDGDPAADDPRTGGGGGEPRRVVVGLVGWPNVGKSSTLNALIGAKATGVGATPGKTKHFQTFNISDTLRLADCPGLVFPSFSDSRAEMVAAGVLPIDRLTDVVAPIDVVARRVPRAQLEAVYAMRLPRPQVHEDPRRAPTGRELLRAYAASRGLTAGGGLPDETRAGRAILKDYTSGKLLYCEWPPGVAPPSRAEQGEDDDEAESGDDRFDDAEEDEEDEDEEGSDDGDAGPGGRDDAPSTSATQAVGNALLGELKALGLAGGAKQRKTPQRAEHKLQKKGKKEKLRRLARGPAATEGVGGCLITGKRGGLMPASAQVAPLPEFLPALMRNGAGVSSGGAREPTLSGRPSRPASRMSSD